jgi:hypothetical protein
MKIRLEYIFFRLVIAFQFIKHALFIMLLLTITNRVNAQLNINFDYNIDRSIHETVVVGKRGLPGVINPLVNINSGGDLNPIHILYPSINISALKTYNYSTVNFNDGNIRGSIYSNDNSIININGGHISPNTGNALSGTGNFYSYGNSIINRNSGYMDYSININTYEHSIYNQYGGYGDNFLSPSIISYDNSIVNLQGGRINTLYSRGNSTVNTILDTSYIGIGGGIRAAEMHIQNNSTVNLLNGTWQSLIMSNSGIVNVTNANILGGLAMYDSSKLTYNGANLKIEGGLYVQNNSSVEINGNYGIKKLYTPNFIKLVDNSSILIKSGNVIDSIFLYNNSYAKLIGGIFGDLESNNTIECYNNSKLDIDGIFKSNKSIESLENSSVNINGGNISRFYTSSKSTAKINGGYIGEIYANSNVNITGGSINNLKISRNSQININDGIVNEILNGMQFTDTSILNINGGIVNTFINSRANGKVNIYGGTVKGNLVGYDNGYVKIVDGIISGTSYINNNSNIDMIGGEINSCYIYDNAKFYINSGVVSGFISTRGTGKANIHGGLIEGTLYARFNGRVNIYGGDVGTLDTYNSSVANVSGGTIKNYLRAQDNSIINLMGGNVIGDVYGNGGNVYAGNNSTINIWGGTTGSLFSYDNSLFNFFGSNLTSTLDNSSIYELGALGDGYFTRYALNGALTDGTSLSGKFLYIKNGSTGSFTLNNSGISAPEPTTLSLLALGCLGMGFVTRRRIKPQ